ncbi:MAG: FxLYD domain-containing protein [Anaerolineae bacterium]|nr:FxLYD domain-containing protein [Anaerolineae bacterium]
MLTLNRQRFVWLWCWLGVLVVGCSGSASTTALNSTPTSATPLATFVLLGWTLTPPTPLPTSTPIPRLLRTPTLPMLSTVTLMPTSSAALSAAETEQLLLAQPTCYETATGSLYCLGVVENTLLLAVEHIMIRVYLVDVQGSALAQGESGLAQMLLLPGERAPYGVLFDSAPAGVIGGVAMLINAQEAQPQDAAESAIFHLLIQDVTWNDWQVSGLVVNKSGQKLEQVCVIVTLYDKAGAVTGFRIWRSADQQVLVTGATLPFEITAIPQGNPVAQWEVSAEGYTVRQNAGSATP